MKLTSILFLSFALFTLGKAQSPIPDEVFYGTEVISGKEFSLWEERKYKNYDGQYSGDIGGDTAGTLSLHFEEKVYNTTGRALDSLASGIYKQRTAGAIDSFVTFRNIYYDPEAAPSGPISFLFVKYKKEKGVIMGKYFIPKEK